MRHLRHSHAALAALTCGSAALVHLTRCLRTLRARLLRSHSVAARGAREGPWSGQRRLRHSHAALAALTCDTHMRHLRHSHATLAAALTSHMLHLRHSFWHSSSTIKVTALALRNLTCGTQIAVTRGTHNVTFVVVRRAHPDPAIFNLFDSNEGLTTSDAALTF